jgi:hypothetical protein
LFVRFFCAYRVDVYFCYFGLSILFLFLFCFYLHVCFALFWVVYFDFLLFDCLFFSSSLPFYLSFFCLRFYQFIFNFRICVCVSLLHFLIYFSFRPLRKMAVFEVMISRENIWRHLLSSDALKHRNAQTSKRPNAKTSKHWNVESLKRQNVETTKRRKVETYQQTLKHWNIETNVKT